MYLILKINSKSTQNPLLMHYDASQQQPMTDVDRPQNNERPSLHRSPKWNNDDVQSIKCCWSCDTRVFIQALKFGFHLPIITCNIFFLYKNKRISIISKNIYICIYLKAKLLQKVVKRLQYSAPHQPGVNWRTWADWTATQGDTEMKKSFPFSAYLTQALV